MAAPPDLVRVLIADVQALVRGGVPRPAEGAEDITVAAGGCRR